MSTRACKMCQIEKQLEEFPAAGPKYRRHYCKVCYPIHRATQLAALDRKPCVALECENDALSTKEYCNSHYSQWTRLGYVKPLYSTQRKRGESLVRDSEGRKQCFQCKNWSAESEFGPHKKSADGLRSECAECRKRYYESNRERISERTFLAKYGISLQKKLEMLNQQGGKCAACLTDFPGVRGWQMDHDHSCCGSDRACSKCLRKVLCSRCNLVLGNVNDDINVLQRMLNYLREFHGKA